MIKSGLKFDVDFSTLPRINGCIDWTNSVGLSIKFKSTQSDLFGNLLIKDYNYPKVTLEYRDTVLTPISIQSLLRSQLGNILRNFVKLWTYNVGEIVKTNSGKIKILEHVRLKNNCLGYKYECLIDGNIDYIYQSNLLKGLGCNVCSNQKIMIGVNDLWTTHPNIAKLLKNPDDGYIYSYGSTNKLIFICPDCGTERELAICKATSRGFRCNICGDGIPIGEKMIFSLLSLYTDDIEREKIFDWAKDKKYDFYSKKLNIIIEVFGSQHYKEEFSRIKTTKRKAKTLKEEQENDKIKRCLAIENGFSENNYIVIDSRVSELEYIKNNIINSNLCKYINLESCDWDYVYQRSLTSKMMEACKIYNETHQTTSQIAKILGLSTSTICKYLKRCAESKLCDYDSYKECHGHVENAINATKIKVICITTKEIFNSISSASRKYNVSTSHISQCCSYKRKTAGQLPDGTHLLWMYYDDYLDKPQEKIDEMIHNSLCRICNKIVCLNTKEIFNSYVEATNFYGFQNSQNISFCCNGKNHYAYKDKDGNKLIWVFYEDYLDMTQEDIEYKINLVNKPKKQKVKKTKKKQVYVYDKNKCFLKCYDSITDTSNKSVTDFGIKFNISNISEACNGKNNGLYKKHIFSYTPLESQSDYLLLCSNL